jgi:hypothetical protein
MVLKDLMSKAQEIGGTAADAVGKLLDEFNEALPTMRALGFTVKDMRMGMGLIPEIGAKLVASTDTIDPARIKELIEKHPENKTLVAALKGLQTAYNLKQSVGNVPFKGVEVDMSLGLPPHIGIAFLTSDPTTPTALAAPVGRAA